MLVLAMSIFQGREQHVAFEALMRHAPDGVQLTPGNLPSPGFREQVEQQGVHTRPHHGFAWESYRRPVYTSAGQPIEIERDRSVHPPRSAPPKRARGSVPRRRPAAVVAAAEWLPLAQEHDLLVETMYPGYVLGTGDELEVAMALRLRLAVDVSHLQIQREAGVLSDRTYRALLDYEKIEEVHVSTSRGRHDVHAPLHAGTPGLEWARERLDDLPVVIESYWHRVSFDDQRRQIDLVRQ